MAHFITFELYIVILVGGAGFDVCCVWLNGEPEISPGGLHVPKMGVLRQKLRRTHGALSKKIHACG